MRQIVVVKKGRPKPAPEVDTRTPSGRLLPY